MYACACACARGPVAGRVFYAISVNYLHKKKQNLNLLLASRAGDWLLDREFDLHVGAVLTWCMAERCTR
jgi:hypothetical protein